MLIEVQFVFRDKITLFAFDVSMELLFMIVQFRLVLKHLIA